MQYIIILFQNLIELVNLKQNIPPTIGCSRYQILVLKLESMHYRHLLAINMFGFKMNLIEELSCYLCYTDIYDIHLLVLSSEGIKQGIIRIEWNTIEL